MTKASEPFNKTDVTKVPVYARLRELIEQADSGVYSQNDLVAFCEAQMVPATPVFFGSFDIPQRFDAEKAFMAEQTALLRTTPRGTWLIVRRTLPADKTVSSLIPIMSAGNGQLSAHRDHYTSPPAFGEVYWRMLASEVYRVQQIIEGERQQRADLAAIRYFATGQMFRHIRLRDHYATAKVTAVDPVTGKISLVLSKRGTRNRWTREVGAAVLLRHLPNIALALHIAVA